MRILSLGYETMREDYVSRVGMDVRRELLVDLHRLALRDTIERQEGACRERSERLRAESHSG
jgi:hypothetical protein